MLKMSMKRDEAFTAYAFILPFLLGYLIFQFLPLLYSLFISFIKFNRIASLSDIVSGKIGFAGFQNYTRILGDKIALSSFLRTFIYSLIFVPARLALGLILALIIRRDLYFRSVTRTMMLIPYVANIVAVAIVFSIMLDAHGPLNTLLSDIGVKNVPNWLMDQKTALPVTILVHVWQSVALNTIVFLAALQDIPGELYESSDIDGANWLQKVYKITLPLISPATFFLLINNLIVSFSNYALIKNLTKGGPGIATRVSVFNIYEEAFTYNHFSYSSAQATILFLILLMITILQWKGQKKWVHY
jgi:multiple sugar transport system permease protein